jgi:hypothetical protein
MHKQTQALHAEIAVQGLDEVRQQDRPVNGAITAESPEESKETHRDECCMVMLLKSEVIHLHVEEP